MNMGKIRRNYRFARGCSWLLIAAVGGLIPVSSVQAASAFWDGTNSNSSDWGTLANWSTLVGVTTDPASIPGTATSDTVTFTTTAAGGTAQTVNLNGNRSVTSITFNATATGGTTLLGGSGNSILTLNASGATAISMAAGSGQVTIGSATAGQNVSIVAAASQNFNNSSSSLLTINNGVSNSAAATITLNGTGSGGITFNGVIANGTGTTSLTVNNASGGGINTLTAANTYTGATTITKGTLVLSGANGAILGTGGITISADGFLTLDDRGASSANTNRLANTNGITLGNGSTFKYLGSDQTSTNSTETIGAITLSSGYSTITISYGGTNSAVVTTNSGSFTRTAGTGGSALVNGVNLGVTGSTSAARMILASAPTLVGTTNATSGINSSAHNTKIVPYLLGEATSTTGGLGTATGTANTFLTYDATTGLRPLNPTDEFTQNSIVSGDNTRITSDTTSSSTASINSLLISGGDLLINNGTTLTDTSGVILFTTNNSIMPSGTTGKLGFGSAEGILHANAGITGKIRTEITGAGGLTIYGPGRILLSGANSYTGTTTLATNSILVAGADNILGSSTFAYASGAQIQSDGPNRTLNTQFNLGNSSFIVSGFGDLTFSGNGSAPAFTVATSANQSLTVNNTGTTTISGAFVLNNATGTGVNNGTAFLALGSGANVIMSGAILDNLSGNQAVGGAATITFNGTGSNVTIAPASNNNFGATKTFAINISGTSNVVAGYNTLTIGGPGGSGATITPFGQATYTSNVQGALLVAATNGQILGNNISSGASGANFAFIHGFAGANDLTLGGTFTTGAAATFANIATGTLKFSSTLSLNNNATPTTFALIGSGNTIFDSSSSFSTSNSNFTKVGSGTLTLAGTNNLTGNNSFNGGTVILDYSGGNANRISAGTTATALTLGGVDLQLKGGNYTQALGTGGGTTLNSGYSKITQTASGTSTLALGAITRAAGGGTIDFGTGAANTSTANTAGILGAYATYNGTDFAFSNGAGTAITGASSVALATSAGTDTNNSLASGTVTGVDSRTTNSLKIVTTTTGESLSIAATKTLTLTSGGLLFAGTEDYSITGGTLRAGGTSDLIVHQNSDDLLTISSVLGGTSNNLVKTGRGTLYLSGSTAITGGTFVTGGILKIDSSSNIGTGSLNLNNGTLEVTTGFTTSRNLTLGANGGTLAIDSGTMTMSGVISSSTYSGLTKSGSGTLVLSGINTYRGPTNINQGTLQVGNTSALGDSSLTANRAVSPVTVNGGNLDIAGFNAAVGNVVLKSGNLNDSVGTGSLSAYSFTLESGTVNAKLSDLALNTSGNAINLYKTTTGTATINNTSTYSGTTYVNAGTLLVNGTLSNSNVRVAVGATLGGSGTIGKDSYIEGKLSAGNSPGTLTFNQDLTLAATSESIFEINGLTPGLQFDVVNVLGDMIYDGTLTLNFGMVLTGGETFNLFNVTGTSLGSFDTVNVLGGYSGTFDASSGIFTVAAVPEPSTYAMIGLGLGALALLRRRKK